MPIIGYYKSQAPTCCRQDAQAMPTVTQLGQLDPNLSYSYADYLSWQITETVELIKGKIMPMSPAPTLQHQRISADITGLLYNFFRHTPCQFFAAPFDVRLFGRNQSLLANQDIHTVVQPDLCVVCNTALLDAQGCNGAPDWIIEILSKSTAKRDMQIKYQLYQENGVAEYWLVYPHEQVIQQFVLDTGQYRLHGLYTDDDIATPLLFPDLAISLTDVFA